MPQPRSWPLSQAANKPQGVCSVCRAVRQLHLNGNTVHRHGPRNNPCPGSDKAPLGQPLPPPSLPTHLPATQPLPALDLTVSPVPIPHSSPFHPQPTLNPLAPAYSPTHNTPPFIFTRPSGPLLKHIPRSARSACCTLLSSILRRVTSTSGDLVARQNLLELGSKILSVHTREGKRQNLTNLIKSCTASFPDLPPNDATSISTTKTKQTRRPSKDPEAKLAAAVSAKIEDGNLKGAIRLLCSEEKMAGSTPETYNKLQEKHPLAPTDRRPLLCSSPPQQPLQVTEAEVAKAIKSFPPGSSGGPDGLRPQHLLDLIKCAESGGGLCLLSRPSSIFCSGAGAIPTSVHIYLGATFWL